MLFTSDNGATYVGGMDAAFFDSHDGRQGHKGQVYEGGIRVPLVARCPGRFSPGATSSVPVSSVDLTATVMDLVGAPLAAKEAEGLDTWSFAEVLRRPNTWSGQRPFLYWEFKPHGAQAVREGPWKLVRTGLKSGEPGALYHLVDAPRRRPSLGGARRSRRPPRRAHGRLARSQRDLPSPARGRAGEAAAARSWAR